MLGQGNSCWLLSDDAAGNFKQCQALAGLLGLNATALRVEVSGLSRWLSPQWMAARAADIFLLEAKAERAQSLQELVARSLLPQLAIGCGRAGAAALDAIKHLAPACRTIQILDPRCSPSRYDLVICPKHDRLIGPNVLEMLGSLHELELMLDSHHQSQGNSLLLLVGSPTRNAPWTPEQLSETLDHLIPLAEQSPLRISSSRRTHPEILRKIQNHPIAKRAGVEIFSPCSANTENPYSKWRAEARRIVLTPDSVNMICEAVAGRAQVHVLWPECARGKMQRFLQNPVLEARFDSWRRFLSEHSLRIPLNDGVSIAKQVAEHLKLGLK